MEMWPAFHGLVPVCLRCRSRNIRPQARIDGLWPGGGEGGVWVCDACNHLGAPLLVAPDEAGAAAAGQEHGAAVRRAADAGQEDTASPDDAALDAAWKAEIEALGMDSGAAHPPARASVALPMFLIVLGIGWLLPVLWTLWLLRPQGVTWSLYAILSMSGLIAIGVTLVWVGAALLRVRRRRDEPDADGAALATGPSAPKTARGGPDDA